MVLYEFTQGEIQNFVIIFGATLREGGWKGIKLLPTLLLLCGTECYE